MSRHATVLAKYPLENSSDCHTFNESKRIPSNLKHLYEFKRNEEIIIGNNTRTKELQYFLSEPISIIRPTYPKY